MHCDKTTKQQTNKKEYYDILMEAAIKEDDDGVYFNLKHPSFKVFFYLFIYLFLCFNDTVQRCGLSNCVIGMFCFCF